MTGSDDDRWPAEPDDPSTDAEPDEAELVDDLGPDTPEVEIPAVPDPSQNEVPEDLAKAFWRLVIIFNISLLALGVGPMLIFFEGMWVDGTGVFAVGVITFAYGYLRYRRVTSDDDLTDEAKDGEDGDHDGSDPETDDDHNG